MPDERVTWVGHSTALLELGGARLLTDPVLGPRIAHLRRQVAAPQPEHSRALDAVLISHAHRDHLDAASLRRLDRDALVVVPRGAARLVRRLGFARIAALAAGDDLAIGGASVRAVPAVHANIEALGYVVAGEQRVYFAGDTDLFAGMAALAGGLDVALLPIWGWGPSLGPGHLDPLNAARALALLRPRVAIPIHWGTLFPAGFARVRGRGLTDPPRAFAEHARRLAPSVDVRVLAPGQALALPVRAAA